MSPVGAMLARRLLAIIVPTRTFFPKQMVPDIPRQQTLAQRPPFAFLFQQYDEQSGQIHVTYRKYRYRLTDIADHFGVHAATVSRRVFYWKT